MFANACPNLPDVQIYQTFTYIGLSDKFTLKIGSERLSNVRVCHRVNSGNFGHQVNSDIYFQTVEILMRRLFKIFNVCFVTLFLFQ